MKRLASLLSGNRGAAGKRYAMSKFPRKTALAGAAVVTVAGYAFAAQLSPGSGPMQPYGQAQGMPQHGGMMGPMHSQMVQGHGGIGAPGVMNGHQFGPQAGRGGIPTMPGQDAFGTIQEIVSMLEADPSTDWSKVDIAALREHLIDMNEVTLHAVAQERMVDGGIEIAVTGAGRTLTAIKHMVPAHVSELRLLGWNAKTEELPDGVKLTVLANGAVGLAKLKALGFMGIMVQGTHHQVHHLMMAKGEMPAH
jgi:hypothetical protein